MYSPLRGAITLSFLLHLARAQNVTDFDWANLEPSEDLRYTPCYDGFRCARLLVPLDWKETPGKDQAKAAIAILTVPATVDSSDPSFGGTIITNPGGPGGSGVEFNLHRGRMIQTLVDGEKHYEILSFDPRGTGRTTPSADCYEGDEFAREMAALQRRAVGAYSEGGNVMHRHFAASYGHGSLCNHTANGFLTTASVSRDMVEMVDRTAELRAKEEVGRGGLLRKSAQKPMGVEDDSSEKAKIQYFGFSYGTVLGNTFASMYPDRVGRMILDGVEDIYDYYSTDWAMNLADTEKAVEYFYQQCFRAGVDRCPLRWSDDKKWENIKARVDKLIADLSANAVSYVADNHAYVITNNDALLAMFRPMYSPLGTFPALAETLNALLVGNFTPLVDTLGLSRLQESCPLPGASRPEYTWGADALSAIACSDGDDITSETPASYAKYVKRLFKDSPTFGDGWADIRLSCVGWQVRPKWRFTGPFGAPGPKSKSKDGRRTAAPVLFTSSRYDPVTPLRNAYTMSKLFPDSSVVVQESVGHCSISSPSVCMKRIVEKYFETGEVPPSGTSCEADCGPWEHCATTSALELALSPKGDFPLGVI